MNPILICLLVIIVTVKAAIFEEQYRDQTMTSLDDNAVVVVLDNEESEDDDDDGGIVHHHRQQRLLQQSLKGGGLGTRSEHYYYDKMPPNMTLLDENINSSDYNVSSSNLAGEDDESLSTVLLVLKSCTLILIIVLAVLSNLLVVLSVVRYHKLRHINNYFLVSLAVADLLVACFAMTFNATVEITGRWNFGYRICDLWNSLDVHFSTVSTLHLCCISVDRYFAIVKPLKYTSYMTVKVAAVMIVVAWTAPTLISFLPIFLGWYTTDEHEEWRKTHPNECVFRVNQPYAFISSTLTFWAPVVVMLIMYHRIYKEALRQKESIRRSSVPSQQHLIVDSDRIRSRFQELQANGFRVFKSRNKPHPPTPPQQPPLAITATKPQAPTPSLPPPSVSPSSPSKPSQENLQKPILEVPSSSPKEQTEKETKKTSNGGIPLNSLLSPNCNKPSVQRSLSHSRLNTLASFGEEEETVPLRYGECETKFNGGRNRLSPPIQRSRHASLTPLSGSTNLLTVASRIPRRVSMAHSIASEGLRERNRNYSSWRKEHKAFVTLGIVMGAFLLCWLPFFTWYLTVTICGDYYCPCPNIVVSILFWIGYFNSTLNPVIYVMTNRDFKDAFTDILRKTFCWFKRKDHDSQKEWAGMHTHSNVEYV